MNSEAAKFGHGKSGLIRAVIEEMAKNKLPVSRRKAEKAVNAVFSQMKRALKRGERVELPVGSIQVVAMPEARKKQRVRGLTNIHDGESAIRLVKSPGRMIRFWPKKQLIQCGPFPPPPPSPEVERKVEEIEQLFREITGRQMDILATDFKTLMQAADNNLDGLLACLRQIKKDGIRTDWPELAGRVRQMRVFIYSKLGDRIAANNKKPAVATKQSRPAQSQQLTTAIPPAIPPQPPAQRKSQNILPPTSPSKPDLSLRLSALYEKIHTLKGSAVRAVRTKTRRHPTQSPQKRN
jgi:nucleoid DNA-binding protein